MAIDVIPLKGGFTTTDPRLDRIPFFDERSRDYPAVDQRRGATRPALRSNSHNFRKYNAWLDQKSEGACCSFGIGHDLMCYPQEVPMHNELCRTLYFEMQKIDPWPGGAYPGASPFYEGTSVLAGLKIYLEYLKLADPYKRTWEFRWCFGGDDVVTALTRRGVIIGVPWLSNMFETDENGFIHASGYVAGGHCTYLNGQKLKWRDNVTHYEPKDLERELTVIRGRNSWGNSWGQNGDFYITLTDLDKLLAQDGEAAVLTPTA